MPLPGPTISSSDVVAGSFAHTGSESIGSGRGFGALPANVTTPTIAPGPSAVSVGAGAGADADCAAGAGDGCDSPHPTTASSAPPTHTTVSRRAVSAVLTS